LNIENVPGRCQKVSPELPEGNNGGEDKQKQCADDGDIQLDQEGGEGARRSGQNHSGQVAMMVVL